MEALKEAQNANAANIAKTTFLNHMSHDISRIESGKLKYKPVPVDLRDMTDTVLSIARGYMECRLQGDIWKIVILIFMFQEKN